MHHIFGLRGIKHECDKFINELSAQYFYTKVPIDPLDMNSTEEGKVKNAYVQVAVRPIALYEVVFPKEHYDVVMTTIYGQEFPESGFKKVRFFQRWLRRIMGLDEVKKWDGKICRPIYNHNLAIYPIGNKDDIIRPNGTEQL